MKPYDEQLQELRRQIARKKQLDAMLSDLCERQYQLNRKVLELKVVKQDEQDDVDRLEGRSLAAFFYAVVGKKDEKLNAEREEAYAAAVKYDAAVRELESVQNDIAQYELELEKLQHCEARYASLLEEKMAALKETMPEKSAEILQLEETLSKLEYQRKEILEARAAGEKALYTANAILKDLNSAHDWGVWDMVGGGLITDLFKHDHLDHAQNLVEQLHCDLSRFKTELADVRVDADMQVSIDGFLRFADYFFDGLFADWAVIERIDNSLRQVERTRDQIKQVLERLQDMREDTEQLIKQNRAKLNALVENSSL